MNRSRASRQESGPRLRLWMAARAGRRHAAFVARYLRRAHRLVGSPVRELSVAIIGETEMSRLHQRYLGLSGPTDVMSFPLQTDRRGKVCEGQIIVCAGVAARQARRWGTSVRKELLLYAIHGLLHLSGFDDRTPEDSRTMHRVEDRLLERMGIGEVFAPSSGSPGRPHRKRSARAYSAGIPGGRERRCG